MTDIKAKLQERKAPTLGARLLGAFIDAVLEGIYRAGVDEKFQELDRRLQVLELEAKSRRRADQRLK